LPRNPGAEGLRLAHTPFSRSNPFPSLGFGQIRVRLWGGCWAVYAQQAPRSRSSWLRPLGAEATCRGPRMGGPAFLPTQKVFHPMLHNLDRNVATAALAAAVPHLQITRLLDRHGLDDWGTRTPTDSAAKNARSSSRGRLAGFAIVIL
jgi:hypothetical protein